MHIASVLGVRVHYTILYISDISLLADRVVIIFIHFSFLLFLKVSFCDASIASAITAFCSRQTYAIPSHTVPITRHRLSWRGNIHTKILQDPR